jgi:general secretion pathway protein E
VFTTVHANNVFDVLSRFAHMEVDPYAFVSALNGIMAQRLIRVVCEQCAEPHQPAPEMIELAGLSQAAVSNWTFRVGRGCAHCRGTGYKGRKAIGELLVLTDELREAIVARAPARRLKEMAEAGGSKLMRTVALELVREGKTTLLEANRVTAMA